MKSLKRTGIKDVVIAVRSGFKSSGEQFEQLVELGLSVFGVSILECAGYAVGQVAT